MPTLNIIQTRQDIAARLRDAGIDEPMREASYLLSAALNLMRGEMLALDELDLTDDQAARLATFILRRSNREPLARIVGEKEFWGLRFGLNDDTLVPRPDTETLVETVLAALPDHGRPYRILDLGTGTGCILLSLLHELKGATGIGADLSPGAVAQATANATSLKLATRATIVHSDWLSAVEGSFDIIVSNPPYIALSEKDGLMEEVRTHDPALALFADDDGLAVYKALIPQLAGRLNPGGVVALEVGAGQAGAVGSLLQAAFPALAVSRVRDLGGIERVLLAR